MKINIETIPHNQQRYPTCGDYWYDEQGTLQVRVSDMGNEFYEKMVVIHELIEEALVKLKGISVETIDEFDINYEKEREAGLHSDEDEPGFDDNAPYRNEHTLANAVELMMCANADISLNDYDKAVNSL